MVVRLVRYLLWWATAAKTLKAVKVKVRSGDFRSKVDKNFLFPAVRVGKQVLTTWKRSGKVVDEMRRHTLRVHYQLLTSSS